MTKDVVCGMDVDESSDYQSFIDGRTFYFCSEECKKKFDINPLRYTR